MNGAVHDRRRPPALAVAAQSTMVTLAVVMAILIAVLTVRTLVIWNVPDLGLTTSSDFSRLVVEDHSAAARAGVRTGDRIDWPALTPFERNQLNNGGFAGQTLDLAVDRGGQKLRYAFRIPAEPRTADRVIPIAGFTLVAVLVLLLAAFVLARRRSLDAVAFWLIALGPGVGSLSGILEFTTTAPTIVASTVIATLFGFGQMTGALWLGLRFLPPSPGRAIAERAWLGFMGALVGMSVVYNIRQALYGALPPPAVQMLFADQLLSAIYFPGLILVAVLGLVRTHGAARARVNWFALGVLLNVAATVIQAISVLTPSAQFSSLWFAAVNVASCLGTVAYAYPILRHDVFGVGFAVNRAVIYSVVTGLVVGVFAAANWFVGLALKSTGLALPLDLLLAGCAGLSLNVVQKRATIVVDRVLFRRRFAAEQRLRHVARALNRARDQQSIEDAIVAEPCETLALHGAALFTLGDDGLYRRVAAHGWPDDALPELPESDRLVRYLLGGDGTPVVMDRAPHADGLPHGAPRPRHAFPLWSRGELVGIAFYSAHRSGALLDPQEVAAIERIADAATAAFDRVAAAALRRTQEELADARAENVRLRALVERTTA